MRPERDRRRRGRRRASGCPLSCSGAMNPGVPDDAAHRRRHCRECVATPQSMTSTSPNRPSMMFSGLRSRCTMPCACANDTASQMRGNRSAARRATRAFVERVDRAARRARASSRRTRGRRASVPASCTGTMPGCSSRARIRASSCSRRGGVTRRPPRRAP